MTLNLEGIQDAVVRENLLKIADLLNNNPFLSGNWRHYEFLVEQPQVLGKLKHNLSFTPEDILVTGLAGDYNFTVLYHLTDENYIYFTAAGPVRVRLVAGRVDRA
jgi:hypothetical protein